MLNVPEQQMSVDVIKEFNFEFLRREASFAPGETVAGNVTLNTTVPCIEVVSVKLYLLGVGRLTAKQDKKNDSIRSDVIYVKREWTVLLTEKLPQQQNKFPFEERLPDKLPTSIDGKYGRIQYTLKAVLQYKTIDGLLDQFSTIRGFTITENLDLSRLKPMYFQNVHLSESKNYGWCCSCWGGYIRIVLNIERAAFVCGESIVINGTIENKCERRVEKVSGVIEQYIYYGNNVDTANEVLTNEDCIEIHEDQLALFVDAGEKKKIERMVHVPSLPPTSPKSSFFVVGGHVESRRGRASISVLTSARRISLGSIRGERGTSPPPFQRILSLSYALSIRVKAAGSDIIQMAVPIIIGSLPLKSTESKALQERRDSGNDIAVYRQVKTDKSHRIMLEQEKTAGVAKAQMLHVNKYPFYADLLTSSKQSKKIAILSTTLKAEAQLMRPMKHHMEVMRRQGTPESVSETIVSSSDGQSVEKHAYSNSEFVEDSEGSAQPIKDQR